MNILENKDESIGKIVRSGKNNFSIQKTYNLQGIWVSLNLDRPMTAEDIQKIIRKINLYNEMEPEDPISMDSLYQACQKNNLEVEKHEIEANFKVVSLNSKNQLDQAYGLLKQIKQFSRIKKDASELKSFLKLAKTWNQGSHGYVYQLPVANKIEDNFMFLRSLQMRLNQFIEENENKHHVSRSASQREVTNEEG